MHTGRRNQLHLSKLRAFKYWAEHQGYKVELCKGDYEVLRLRNGNEPVLIFWQHNSGDHVTTDKRSQPLVSQWFREREKVNREKSVFDNMSDNSFESMFERD